MAASRPLVGLGLLLLLLLLRSLAGAISRIRRSLTASPAAPPDAASDAPFVLQAVDSPGGAPEEPRRLPLESVQQATFGDISELRQHLDRVDPATVYKLSANCSRTSKCKVAVCTAIYLEDPYLLEWVLYHLMLGISHFFLVHMITLHNVSRLSVAASERVLAPFVAQGLVTTTTYMVVYDAPQVLEQIAAMRFCINTYKARADWLINLDADEYYFSERYPTIPSLLAAAEHNRTDAFAMPWYMFGSSGYFRRPEFPGNLTLEVYHRRAAVCVHDPDSTQYFGRRNGKFLFRTRCFQALRSPHELQVAPGCSLTRPTIGDATYHLKHFHGKSFQDWMWKRHATGFTGFRTKERRDDLGCVSGDNCGFWNSNVRNFLAEWQRSDAMMNDTSDRDLLVYAPMLHRLLAVSDTTPHHHWCQTEAKKHWGPLSCF